MMKCAVTLVISILWASCTAYDATWESLDSRPLPEWYDQAKVGIFLHWGVYSVPAYGSEWFWMQWRGLSNPDYVYFMESNYAPGFTYQEFAPLFTARHFDPHSWAQLFVDSGAKYVVLTSKHHEGYTLWPSTYSYSWNSVDVGPHRDLLGELGAAVREAGLYMGYYYSLLEWYNPMYMADQNAGFNTTAFSDNKVQPELRELVATYQPDIVWSDGEWEASDDYWRSKEFLAWLYTNSSVRNTVVANDRWGSDTLCAHGDFYTCVDRYNPGVLQPFKWENAMTIDKMSWGNREEANINDFLTTYELIETLVITVSCGGNILINVGPTKEGTIMPVYQERLLDLGSWLNVNGEAIYSSTPWTVQNDTSSNTWYTSKPDAVYAIVLDWPTNGSIQLGSVTELFASSTTQVELLGYGALSWSIVDDVVSISLPDRAEVTSNWSWVFKVTNYDTKKATV